MDEAMGRRKRYTNFEAAIEAVALLPWWLCLAAAVVVFFWLHHIASYSAQPPADLKELGDYAGHQLWRTYATLGQFIVPGILVLGAAASAFRQKHARGLYRTTVAAGQQSDLLRMSWQEFEQLVGEHFRRQGFSVSGGGKGGPDGGVNLTLRKAGELSLVQCKQWRAMQVGVDVVRQLYGVMAAQGAAHGYVVTAGNFTQAAEVFASGRNIHLYDGDLLVREMRVQAGQAPAASSNASVLKAAASKTCPSCGAPMVQRKAAKGGVRARHSGVVHPFRGAARSSTSETSYPSDASEANSFFRPAAPRSASDHSSVRR